MTLRDSRIAAISCFSVMKDELSGDCLASGRRRAAVVEHEVSFSRHFGGVCAGLTRESVVAPPQFHSEAGRIAIAHGYATNVVSGPNGEYRRNRHQGLTGTIS